MGKPGRKKTDKTAIHFQKYFGSSDGAEEILFKLNEFLYGAEFQALRKNPRIPVNFPGAPTQDGPRPEDTAPNNPFMAARQIADGLSRAAGPGGAAGNSTRLMTR